MAAEKVDMEKLFNKLLIVYKKTHVTINGQQAQIECSKIWREIKKGKKRFRNKVGGTNTDGTVAKQYEKTAERVYRKISCQEVYNHKR